MCNQDLPQNRSEKRVGERLFKKKYNYVYLKCKTYKENKIFIIINLHNNNESVCIRKIRKCDKLSIQICHVMSTKKKVYRIKVIFAV